MLRVGFSKWYIDDNKQRFEVIVLPQTLTQPTLQLAHEGLDHNGIPQTYALVKVHKYYWKGLKPSVTKHSQAMHSLSET